MKLFSRVNIAALFFMSTIACALHLALVTLQAPASTWRIAMDLLSLSINAFFFMRTALLYIREGEPSSDAEAPADDKGASHAE